MTNTIDWNAPLEDIIRAIENGPRLRYDDLTGLVTGTSAELLAHCIANAIRNRTQPAPQYPVELVERAFNCLRDLAEQQFCNAHELQAEARDIVADLPQRVDPDDAIAKAAVDEALQKHGMNDRGFGYDVAIAAIKRVRAKG